MTYPKLLEHQLAIAQAEFSTGHVLNKNGSLYLAGNDINDVYEKFDSYDQAKEFVIKKVQNNPEVECWIIDYKGQTIFAYDKNGERKIKSTSK